MHTHSETRELVCGGDWGAGGGGCCLWGWAAVEPQWSYAIWLESWRHNIQTKKKVQDTYFIFPGTNFSVAVQQRIALPCSGGGGPSRTVSPDSESGVPMGPDSSCGTPQTPVLLRNTGELSLDTAVSLGFCGLLGVKFKAWKHCGHYFTTARSTPLLRGVFPVRFSMSSHRMGTKLMTESPKATASSHNSLLQKVH